MNISSWKFFMIFIKQLFSFARSAGSLITETIELIKTFQRASAVKSFNIVLSIDSREMFRWATDFIQKITNNLLQTAPLSIFEIYTFYALAIPLFILNFVSAYIVGPMFIFFIFVYGDAFMFGCGLGAIGIDKTMAISMPLIAIGMLFIGGGFFYYLTAKCIDGANNCFHKQKVTNASNDDDDDVFIDAPFSFTFSLIPSFIIFLLGMFQILMERDRLTLVFLIFIVSALLVSLITEIIFNCFKCCKNYDSKRYGSEVIMFLINCLPLLIIPSTENFIELMNGEYKNRWNCIISYIIISLSLPISMVFIKVHTKDQETIGKYKDKELYPYIELIDYVKQICYAISSSYDVPYGCIGIELAWIIFIIITRPYNNISEYSLQ